MCCSTYLDEIGYLSSYTHSGRYYTLADIPTFDRNDLWRCQAIGFSRFGTLKATLAHRVESADTGCTHAELEALLGLRVYNTLLRLTRAKEVSRELIGGTYLYLSSDQARASQQLVARRQRASPAVPLDQLPAEEVVLRVLVEVVHASSRLPTPSVVAARLSARGEEVAIAQIVRIYEHFQLRPGKKTAGRR